LQLETADMVGLFRHAVQQQHCDTAEELLYWFRSGQFFPHKQSVEFLHKQTVDILGMPYLLALLQAATQQCRTAPEALRQMLDPAATIELLQLAIAQGGNYESLRDMSTFEAICSLYGLQEAEPPQAVDLLLLALQHGNTAAAKAIAEGLAPAMNLASARNAGRLLQVAKAKKLLHANQRNHTWFAAAAAAQLRSLAGKKKKQGRQ
jgi:hypothetical protein